MTFFKLQYMHLLKKISFSLLTLFLHAKSYSQLDYANELASTIMKTYKDSMVVKKFGNHLLQDNQVLPGQSIEDAQMNRPAVWNYETGVILFAFEKLAQATGSSPSAPWYSCRRESRPERNRLGQIAFRRRQQIIGRTALSCLDLLIFDGLYLPQGRQSGFDLAGVWRR